MLKINHKVILVHVPLQQPLVCLVEVRYTFICKLKCTAHKHSPLMFAALRACLFYDRARDSFKLSEPFYHILLQSQNYERRGTLGRPLATRIACFWTAQTLAADRSWSTLRCKHFPQGRGRRQRCRIGLSQMAECSSSVSRIGYRGNRKGWNYIGETMLSVFS